MAIRVSCPSCKSDVHVDESLAGKDILCPSCRERMSVPSIAAGQPEMMPSEADDDRYREGAGPGGLPRWGDSEEYDVPMRRDSSRWNATLTGLNLIFWTSLIIVILSVITQGVGLALGSNPQMIGPANPGAPPAGAMAFGLGMMAVGCAIIVLMIVWYVGMCMCCTVPSESGARGKAIATVILVGISVIGGLVAVVALSLTAVAQVQKMGGPPPPGVMPFPIGVLVTLVVIAALDGVLLVSLWLLFHKSIANYFRNTRLSKMCVWFIVFYIGTAAVTWALNIVANPVFHGGNVLQGPTPLLMIANIWGLLVMIALSAWYLYINRATTRMILEDQGAAEGDVLDGM